MSSATFFFQGPARLRLIAAALAAGLVVGPVAAVAQTPAPAPARDLRVSAPTVSRERMSVNRRVFDRVWNEVRREYYDPGLHGVDWRAARATYRPQALDARDDRELYAVLDRMLGLLDDEHAGVAAPAVARRQDGLRTRRAVLGVSLFPEADGVYRIERVRAGSPADEGGIGVGWRLNTGQGLGWSPDRDVVDGRPVTLNFTDETGQVHDLTLTPRLMDPLPAFVADRSRPGVLVLRVEGFEAGLGQWMGAQLADLPADTDVVVDLRGNPGGLLSEADAVLSCFLPQERAWATRRSRSGRTAVLRTEGGCGDLDAPAANPLAILVDETSRSAAELTPAALQEARRAVVVGERTAGAVLISQESDLPDGGRLTLSRADFVTAGGVRLEKRGVDPDLAVPTSRDVADGQADAALETAIAALTTPPGQNAASIPTAY